MPTVADRVLCRQEAIRLAESLAEAFSRNVALEEEGASADEYGDAQDELQATFQAWLRVRGVSLD